MDPKSLGWLGAEAASLKDLAPHGRAWLDPGHAPATRVTGRWSDGAPFIVERDVGRGLAVTVTLPSSIAISDLALRPGFVALVDHWVEAARQRRGLTESVAGVSWVFGTERPSNRGAGRPAPSRGVAGAGTRGHSGAPRQLPSDIGGPPGAPHRDARSPKRSPPIPLPPPKAAATSAAGPGLELTDVSREVAFVLVALLGLELGLRALRALRVDARARFR